VVYHSFRECRKNVGSVCAGENPTPRERRWLARWATRMRAAVRANGAGKCLTVIGSNARGAPRVRGVRDGARVASRETRPNGARAG